MQMRRPYAHFKHDSSYPATSPPCPLTYTQQSHSHVSLSGGLLRWQWGSVMPTRCKTFQLLAKFWPVRYLLKRTFATKSLQLNYPLKEDIAHMYVLSGSISHFILALNLEYGNKGRGAYKGYTAVQGEVEKKRSQNSRVIPLLCFINATPCAPVSGSEGLVRLWRLWAKTDFAPSGGGQAGNMWQLICANKHLWRRRRGSWKPPPGSTAVPPAQTSAVPLNQWGWEIWWT